MLLAKAKGPAESRALLLLSADEARRSPRMADARLPTCDEIQPKLSAKRNGWQDHRKPFRRFQRSTPRFLDPRGELAPTCRSPISATCIVVRLARDAR